MQFTRRMAALLSNFMASGRIINRKRQILAIGGGLAMTAVGFKFTHNTHKSWPKSLSLLSSGELNAEERLPRDEKANQLHQSSLSKSAMHIPPAQWDHNWDKRDPQSLVKPLKPNSSDEEQEAHLENIKAATPTARRTYLLVRHGQYEMRDTDEERILTPLGREQANLTGERLAKLWEHTNRKNNSVDVELSLTMSTMARATETAQIILGHFPNTESKSCDLIQEGAPCEPVPNVLSGVWDPEPHQFFEEGARIEAGFRKYIRRADPSQKNNSIDVLVCHGNVIRYFVCRALQLPPEAWLRFAVHNASITTITVQPTGRVHVSGLGESGHLPPDKLTFN